MRRRQLWLIASGAAATCLALTGWWWWAAFNVPAGPASDELLVEIRPGASARQIGAVLQQHGVVRSAIAFRVVAQRSGQSEKLKAGEYRLSRGATLGQLVEKLVSGEAEARWLVIPEGFTSEQIAALLEERRIANADAFRHLVATRSPRQLGLPGSFRAATLDGYLFPDSYKVTKDVTSVELVRMMVGNFHQKAARPRRERFAKNGLAADEVVTVASLIEREARVDQDRPLISAVVRNRLRIDMPLQIDATLLYALGYHKEQLSNADKQAPSPYNTYLHKGLPPGPICNPGLASIEAALTPAAADYLYYVARPSGDHVFTRTLEEHEAAIQAIKAAAPGA